MVCPWLSSHTYERIDFERISILMIDLKAILQTHTTRSGSDVHLYKKTTRELKRWNVTDVFSKYQQAKQIRQKCVRSQALISTGLITSNQIDRSCHCFVLVAHNT